MRRGGYRVPYLHWVLNFDTHTSRHTWREYKREEIQEQVTQERWVHIGDQTYIYIWGALMFFSSCGGNLLWNLVGLLWGVAAKGFDLSWEMRSISVDKMRAATGSSLLCPSEAEGQGIWSAGEHAKVCLAERVTTWIVGKSMLRSIFGCTRKCKMEQIT